MVYYKVWFIHAMHFFHYFWGYMDQRNHSVIVFESFVTENGAMREVTRRLSSIRALQPYKASQDSSQYVP